MTVPEAMARFLIPPWPDMPKALLIGTEKAFARRHTYKYDWIRLHPSTKQGIYLCKQSISKLADVRLIILKANDSYYACEAIIRSDDSKQIVLQKPCFRTAEAFWQEGEHSWQYPFDDAPAAETRSMQCSRVIGMAA